MPISPAQSCFPVFEVGSVSYRFHADADAD
jgi:hypothetical protein